MPGPEGSSGAPAESVRSPQEIFKNTVTNISVAAAQLNQAGISGEQQGQLVNTVLGGVIELYQQGHIGRNEKLRDFLQAKVFTADPAHQVLAEGLVSRIETMASDRNPQALQAVPSFLELASLLGIDQTKYPDLTPRLAAVKAKINQAEKRRARQERRSNNKKKDEKAISRDNFIPLAGEKALEEPDVTQSALLVAFGDVIGYLPDTLDNRDMLEQAAADNRQALSKLAGLAVGRGYLGRAVQNLTHLTAQYPQRTEEIIPILEALSVCDSRNPDPEVYKLLGDTYLQLGKHKEAIAAYRETLKIPPKE